MAVERIPILLAVKDHAIGLLEMGSSEATVNGYLNSLIPFFKFVDSEDIPLATSSDILQALYEFAEYQFTRSALKKINKTTAYYKVFSVSNLLNGALEDLNFDISTTRLKVDKRPRSAISRQAQKVMLSDASKLARFCYDIAIHFKPLSLTSGELPILVKISNELTNEAAVNLTANQKHSITIEGTDFVNSAAAHAFNHRVSVELMIFLSVTIQNIAPSRNLRRKKFDYKPLGEHYEIREYKHRRGGEVEFKIPKPYKQHFENYLAFISEYASDSEWLFPFLAKGKGFRKRKNSDMNCLNALCSKHGIPWTAARDFRAIGENIFMWLSIDENTASEYAGHAVQTFRDRYEFPSLQRTMIEVGRFWDENDPLTHGKPRVSLFNTPCNGVPIPIDDATDKLPKPDCITPTGCIGCKHYRDEDSFDYIWNLHSFKYLKVIESSSHRADELKPSNIVIDWINLKIEWFKNSDNPKHQEWVGEAEIRIEEGDYHHSWSRKIEKYEG